MIGKGMAKRANAIELDRNTKRGMRRRREFRIRSHVCGGDYFFLRHLFYYFIEEGWGSQRGGGEDISWVGYL